MVHGRYTNKEIELFKKYVKSSPIACLACNNGACQWTVSYDPSGCIQCTACGAMLSNEIMENVIKPKSEKVFTYNGIKLDDGKIKASLIWEFSLALVEVAKVGMSGLAKGYKRGSWKDVPNALDRYNDAFTRHQLEEGEGKVYDEESGLLVAAHTAWNALARLYFIILAERNKSSEMQELSNAKVNIQLQQNEVQEDMCHG